METGIVVIQDKDLELVVSEKTLGSLTTNARQILALVKNAIPKYDVSYYNDDNIEQAKKDKAALNKAAKVLNDRRIEIEREFSKPFAEFKEVVAETVNVIKECSNRIDSVVKANEDQYKEKKKAEIQAYFDENNVNLIAFEKIFNTAWLNKSATLKSVKESVYSILFRIENDINSLESFTEDKDVLITFYTDCLNIGNTLQYANRLREQREKRIAAEAEAERLEAERKKEQAKRFEEQRKEEEVINGSLFGQSVTQPNPDRPAPVIDREAHATVIEKTTEESELLTRAFTVTATRENIIALGDFMNDNGIEFDKIDLDVTLCKTDMQAIEALLSKSAEYVEKNFGSSTKDMDFSRRCRLMSNKLNKKA